LSAYIAAGGRKGAVIVTDSVTSDGLKEFIEKELDGVHYRYRRGYKNVINKAIELTNEGKDCPLAIETSGHAALKENYFLDDGAYLVTKIVIELAKGTDINTLLKPLKMPVEEKEIRFNIKAEDFKTYGLNVIKELEEYASKVEGYKIADDNREGIRVSTENGWFLLRLSVHDPVMPMNFESNIAGGIEKDIDALREFFSKFSELDISALN
jgi:phosphomannomutase